ncbi:hypothetical protein W03_22240 [Nitrosomonas sp. PY1]|uniref:helix-turn-helix domain-containing protein n=1 Tax=Nitrosomonas sp. PY1 TaxID=1803906 RepID=UPI001FC86CF4|nr:helix-turn-helix domain-containing protein [Nitrosomonas sp. PY1]GKS70220.1 hypothetical protein W03_22240 [Nitrosomonas sp. PY1]
MNEKQQQAILMMAEGKAYQEIAEALDVTPKTISQWRTDPAFRAELNQHLHDIKAYHSEKLRQLQGQALKTIEDCLNDPEIPAKDRLAAAFKTLELGKIDVSEPGSTDASQLKLENDFNLKRDRALAGGRQLSTR